ADEVLLLRNLALELGHSGQRLLVLRLSLPVVALGDRAFLETQLLQPCRFTEAQRGLLRDLELPVERSQLDVAAGYCADDGQNDGPLPLLAREQARTRRLRCAAQPAPDIELEARREIHRVIVE